MRLKRRGLGTGSRIVVPRRRPRQRPSRGRRRVLHRGLSSIRVRLNLISVRPGSRKKRRSYPDGEPIGESFVYKLKDPFVAFGGVSLPVGAVALAMSRPTRGQVREFLLQALLSLAALVLLPGGSHAQSVLTDDAHTGTAPKTNASNFGTNPNLFVNAAGNVYVKFKLSSTLPANTPGASVERATLKLYLANVTAAGKLDVYPVAGAWDEATITGRDAPPLGSLLTTTAQIGLDKRGKFIVIDLTPLVQQWLGDDGQGANGAPNNGLAIVAHPADATTPEVASITFDSKENAQTSHEPQLHVQLRGTAGGLHKIERDATLTGDGTAVTPLGVAAGGIDKT